MKYIVFESKSENITLHFALTNEQMNDERSKALFEGSVTEFARVDTVEEMRALNTPKRIAYLRNGKVMFA